MKKVINKKMLIVGLVLATMLAIVAPAQAYTDLTITEDNLDTLDSFTYSGAWYNIGANSYLLKWYGGGEYFEPPWKAPALYYGIITATIMADYYGSEGTWGECVSMVKNLAHSAVGTGSWYRGAHVTDGGISPGTAIATFRWDSTEQRYKYYSDYTCHAAIFREYTYDQYGIINGIMVWDQNWWTNDIGEGVVSMHKFSTTGNGMSNASNYYVIQVP